ncbi:hypothetical protein C5953_06510 [Cronobacter sakazakii]|nr:hypothetical protein C5953_06510 [Cronobacter sakazakii]
MACAAFAKCGRGGYRRIPLCYISCGLRSAVCGLRSAVCGLRSAVCGLRSAVCGPGYITQRFSLLC